jgi:hypothetical protein
VKSLSELIGDVEAEVGEPASNLLDERQIARWLNAGQTRLRLRRPRVATIIWEAGDRAVDLPADFASLESIQTDVGSTLGPHRVFGSTLEVLNAQGAYCTGSARLRYFAAWPGITGASDSLLPPAGDEALVSYCLYRFFKKLASSRAEYRRYSTVAGQNGVDINELDALSERHLQDFNEIQDDLDTVEVVTPFGD